MVAFTYIAKRSGDSWSASRLASEEGPELTAEGSDAYSLQRELKNLSIENSNGGGVQTLLTTISKDVLIFQVNVGGAIASGGGGSATANAGGGGGADTKEDVKEDTKEDDEDSEDDDLGFSLFD